VRKIVPQLALLVVSLAVAIALCELVLRAIGFEFDLAPERVEFGWPDPVTMENQYRSDPDLFWVPKNYSEILESIRGSQVDLLFLGDSCTEFSFYPNFFVRELVARHPGQRIVVRRLGVGGWSSYQGLAQLRRDVIPLAPRFAAFYFGWNDHWIGFGLRDSEINELKRSFLPGLEHSRLWQLVFKLRLALRRRSTGETPIRVTPDEFRSHLQQMVRLSREAGIVPILITAPSAHEPGREPELLRERWLPDLDQLVPLHQRYVAIVREVAREEDAPLCDLEARFAKVPFARRRARFFRHDGIHTIPRGDRKLAAFLMDCFEKQPALRALWEEETRSARARRLAKERSSDAESAEGGPATLHREPAARRRPPTDPGGRGRNP
jgi:lysophospholipase L1-like esterase